MIKKGDTIDLIIESAAYEGKGIGRFEDLAVFVPQSAPGDLVRILITRKKKSFAEGRILEILQPGQSRIKPFCRHASVCGGCTWQHVEYQEQLRFKEKQVFDHLKRIGNFTDPVVLPVLASPLPMHYRNKMEYTFSDRRWLTTEEIESGEDFQSDGLALGLHIPGRFDKILNLQECHLQIPQSFQLMDWFRSYAIEHQHEPWNPFKKQGYLRNLMIRNAVKTGDLMVNVVTFTDQPEVMNDIATRMLDRFPQVTTIVNNINDTLSPSSTGRYQKTYHGPGYITELIGPHSYRIDANTFFQTNTQQAENLYSVAKEFASLMGNEVVYDLYCGVGSLSLFVSDLASKVIGIEINSESVRNADQNAIRNEVKNCFFRCGDMKDEFTSELIDEFGFPDVVITDPPRAGMHQKVVEKLNELAVSRLIYVSCNTTTLARDLQLLSETYVLDKVQPVDMFPHTYHIEAVALLRRRENS
jgi:23S rRNA (uracil1939-C5)-methyltransferase